MNPTSPFRLLGLAAAFTLLPALAASAMLTTAKSEQYGSYIADGHGHALYMFEADRQGKGKAQAQSNCYDA